MNARKFFPLVVVAAGLLAYQNSFTGTFLHDDIGSILENQTIRRLWPIWQALSPPHQVTLTSGVTVEGRPLINLSLALNFALDGYNVWGYHALNLTVHILAGLTLLGIVRRTLLQPRLCDRFGAAADELALTTAVLWMVHPLQTESVTYIIQRAESIMGLLYLLTLYCFIRGVESQRPRLWYSLSVTASALGMATKEVMVTAPVMVMLYNRAFLSGSFREAWQRHRPLYLALASTWILLGLVLASGGNLATAWKNARHIDIAWWEYLATQPGVTLYYLRLCVWPSPLQLLYGWPTAKTWMAILPPAVVMVALLGASVWAWRRSPAWGFVGAWFFLILAPTSSFIPLLDSIAEHRMYLPLAVVVSLPVMGVYSLAGRRGLAVFAVVAVGLGFLTWRRNEDYRRNPHDSLAFALQTAGSLQEAIAHYQQALQTTPDDALTHYNLGTALEKAGRVQEALGHYERAVRLKPDFAYAYNNLGLALAQRGRLPEAIACYQQALRLSHNLPVTHNNLGNALSQAGDVEGAIHQYEQALRLNPDYFEAHSNLGNALLSAGRIQDAILHCEQALQINPDYVEAHNNFGNALLEAGDAEGAIRHYEQALLFNPNLAVVHCNLGNALVSVGKVQDAINHYEEALRIKPDYTEVQNRLARLRAVN